MTFRLGVDVGGTFTDLVLASPTGEITTRKVLSATDDYAAAIMSGTSELLALAGIEAPDIDELLHGTTVATNAILERRGASTGLITTEGFRDVLEIGRLRLARLYDLDFERPRPLVPRRWRQTVIERLDHRGRVRIPLDIASVHAALNRLLDEGVRSIAISLIHSYADDRHEQAVAAIVRERAPDVPVTLSSELLPEVREFERTSTTVTNAYVLPVMEQYLGRLEADLARLGMRGRVLVMQSNGGVMTAAEGRRRPVHVIESGPAAGVIATAGLAGGRDGTPSTNIFDPDGAATVLPTKCRLTVHDGEVLRHQVAGAGGWGDPWQRDPERVLHDVREEKLTAAHVRREYGVVIDEQTLTLDLAATQRLRDDHAADPAGRGGRTTCVSG
jgi:N-methylhydantoinase A